MKKNNIKFIILFILVIGLGMSLVVTEQKSLDNEPMKSNKEIVDNQTKENDEEVKTSSKSKTEQVKSTKTNKSKQTTSKTKKVNTSNTKKEVTESKTATKEETKTDNSNKTVEKEVKSPKTDNSNTTKKETTNRYVDNKNIKIGSKNNGKITVSNRCQYTAQALEKIYQDSSYEYYLSSISSGCIYITVNGVEYTLKQAITKNVVTVYELEENGFKFIKKGVKAEIK